MWVGTSKLICGEKTVEAHAEAEAEAEAEGEEPFVPPPPPPPARLQSTAWTATALGLSIAPLWMDASGDDTCVPDTTLLYGGPDRYWS